MNEPGGPAAPDLLVDGEESALLTLVLAHGAGGPMDAPFMTRFARGVASGGFRAVRFEFPYMAARRRGERRGMPDKEPVLRAAWHEVIARLGGGARLVIGGKSLGGRMASLVADEARPRGLLCLGYPFHPPGRLDRLRTAHLAALETPALIVQGTRDPFGTREEVAGYALSKAIEMHWLEAGDHSWKPPKSSGRSEAQNMAEGIDAALAFLRSRSSV